MRTGSPTREDRTETGTDFSFVEPLGGPGGQSKKPNLEATCNPASIFISEFANCRSVATLLGQSCPATPENRPVP